MLTVRLAVTTAIAGVCLWGLFSLLDTLQEPALLRTEKATVVKGCDPIESDEAVRLCPQLLCQKALLDGNALPGGTRLTITADIDSVDKTQRLVGGNTFAPNTASQSFACVYAAGKVTESTLLTDSRLAELTGQAGPWQLAE
jgi:hypothetical protein